MIFQKNIPLKKYTTFKIGGPAKLFFAAKTKEQIIEAIRQAKKLSLPFFILGGGSNTLASDKEFRGLVIKTENSKLKTQNSKIIAEAGVSLGKLVGLALEEGKSGMEWGAGIPGTVGGAVFGNAGAFSREMKNIIGSVEVFDAQKNSVRLMKNKDCKFAYRQSIFKKNKNLVILACEINLKKGDGREIKKEMQEYLDYRRSHHPKGASAGSVFVNPKGYAARELIDICGLKGKKIGGAQISKVHSNFIVNSGRARAQDVAALITLVKKTVIQNYKIKMQEEIIWFNF
jgi:UDP-N-acetylmuramate dehydrogenase